MPYHPWFIVKDTNEEPVEEVHRVRSRRVQSAGASVRQSWGVPPAQHMGAFANLEALQTPELRGFMEISSHGHRQGQLLVQSPALYSPMEVGGWGESFRLPIDQGLVL